MSDITTGRNKKIDYLKGIGIFCVVFAHCWLRPTELFWFIYRFHMPLFFVISGYLSSNKNEVRFDKYILKKIKQLFVPYSLFFVFSWLASVCILDAEISWKQLICAFLYSGKWLVRVNNWALWYLPLFFLATLIFYFYAKIKDKLFMYIICIVIFVVAPLFQKHMYGIFEEGYIPLSLQVLPGALFFMCLGCVLARNKYDGTIFKDKWKNGIVSILMGLCGLMISQKNSEQILHFETYTYMISAVLILQSIVWFTRSSSNVYIEYMGKNSIYIYGVHRVILAVIQEKIYNDTFQGTNISGSVATALVTILTIIISLGICKLWCLLIGEIKKFSGELKASQGHKILSGK